MKPFHAIRTLCPLGHSGCLVSKIVPKRLSKLGEYVKWHNKDRFHRGINCKPAELVFFVDGTLFLDKTFRDKTTKFKNNYILI